MVRQEHAPPVGLSFSSDHPDAVHLGGLSGGPTIAHVQSLARPFRPRTLRDSIGWRAAEPYGLHDDCPTAELNAPRCKAKRKASATIVNVGLAEPAVGKTDAPQA